MPDARLAHAALSLLVGTACANRTSAAAGAPIHGSDEVQYLSFGVRVNGLFELTGPGSGDPQRIYSLIDASVSELVARIGANGDGRSRQLGFMLVLAPWMVEALWPGKMVTVVEQAFRIAAERNVAVHLSLETHYFWDARPDLWNFYDAQAPGYDPGNQANVEWAGWSGPPCPYRYVDWGTPQRLVPHMCYTSARVRSEIARLAALVGGAVERELETLRASGKGGLFSGITVSSEPSLDDYTHIDRIDPAMGQLMDQDGAPKVRLGYCALTNAGYSPALDFTNAPLWVAFNEISRPGFTTYPWEQLRNGFDPIYQELAAHGSPHWGGTESAPFDGSGPVPAYEYLRRHFDFGATVVVLNTGATSVGLTDALTQAVFGPDALDAYARFLAGR